MGSKKKSAKSVKSKKIVPKKKKAASLKEMLASKDDEIIVLGQKMNALQKDPDLQTAFRVVSEQYIHNLKQIADARGISLIAKPILIFN
jgi:adenosylmethionine-8-amino-7-oxononanoate aminotransferase